MRTRRFIQDDPRVHVNVISRTFPVLFDWAVDDPEIAVDSDPTPPHGIERP